MGAARKGGERTACLEERERASSLHATRRVSECPSAFAVDVSGGSGFSLLGDETTKESLPERGRSEGGKKY